MEQSDRALIDALSTGDSESIRQAIARGANPSTTVDGTPVLTTWRYWGQSTVVDVLLDAGANPNAADHRGMTPLMYVSVMAIKGKHETVLRSLLAAGADPELKDPNGQTARDWAAKINEDPALKAILNEKGSRPGWRSRTSPPREPPNR